MSNYAVRVTLPYDDFADIIKKWADKCSKLIAYQHDADEEVSQTHVHLGLYGCTVKYEALKRMWPDAPGSGNEFWSMKDTYEKIVDRDIGKQRFPVDESFITYMSKGELSPVFVKNFSKEEVEKSRQSWVEPVKADKSGDPSEFYIRKVIVKYDQFTSLQRFTEHIAVDEGSCTWDFERVLSHVRSTTMKMFYHETRRVPHASQYKIVAGTAFLRICEKWNYLEGGIDALKNLWY